MTRWIAGLLLIAGAAWADEVYEPTTPVAHGDVITSYLISRFEMTSPLNGLASITVWLTPRRADGLCALDLDGVCPIVKANYNGNIATDLLNQLNTANLTSNSLRRRIGPTLTVPTIRASNSFESSAAFFGCFQTTGRPLQRARNSSFR